MNEKIIYINFNVQIAIFLAKLNDAEKKKVIIGDNAAAREGDPYPHCNHELKKHVVLKLGIYFI